MRIIGVNVVVVSSGVIFRWDRRHIPCAHNVLAKLFEAVIPVNCPVDRVGLSMIDLRVQQFTELILRTHQCETVTHDEGANNAMKSVKHVQSI
jgi:hypothetical protein